MLVAFAEAACGRLECAGCNGAGHIQRGTKQQTCKRCQGTGREKAPSSAMLDALYKLATFFYASRKAAEMSRAEGAALERFLIVKFAGPDGNKEPERA